MYRHINRHIKAILDRLRAKNDIPRYANLMDAFRTTNVANDRQFQKDYAGFWAFQGVNNAWRQNYFNLLQTIRDQGELDLQQRRQLLKRVCDETHGYRRGKESLEFSFATKLVHMVDHRSPIYDDKVRAFYFLPAKKNSRDIEIEQRIGPCLAVYDALVQEYNRIIENGLLDHSIHRFHEELDPDKRLTDVKVIDSLIWAFVTWAGPGPAFVTEELQYE